MSYFGTSDSDEQYKTCYLFRMFYPSQITAKIWLFFEIDKSHIYLENIDVAVISIRVVGLFLPRNKMEEHSEKFAESIAYRCLHDFC